MTPFRHVGRVRWSETDASGRFHFANAFRWAENAEHDLCRSIRVDAPIGQMPRRAVSAGFLRPIVAGDDYEVELWVEALGRTSIGYGWRVTVAGAVAVEGRHTSVHLDEQGVPAPLDDPLRAGLTVHLKER